MRASHPVLLVVLGLLLTACSTPSSSDGVKSSAISNGPVMEAELVCKAGNGRALQAFEEGYAAQENGDTDTAIEAYRQAINLDTGFCDAMDNLGLLLRQQGRVEEAIEWYRKSLALAPDNPVAHMNLGVALRLQGDLDGAEAEYLALVEIDPQDPEGHYGLGQIDLDRERPLDAIPHFITARDLYEAAASPWLADAEYSLGVAHAHAEDCVTALTYFEPLYPANPEIPELNWYMGVCYVMPDTEDLQLAKKHLLEAQRLGIEIPQELAWVME